MRTLQLTNTNATSPLIPNAYLGRDQWPEPVRVQVGNNEWRVDNVEFHIDPMGTRSVRVVAVPPTGYLDLDRSTPLPVEDDEPQAPPWAQALADKVEELAARFDDLAHNLEDK